MCYLTKEEIIELVKWAYSRGLEEGLGVDSSISEGEFSKKYFEDMFQEVADEAVSRSIEFSKAHNYQISKIRKEEYRNV